MSCSRLLPAAVSGVDSVISGCANLFRKALLASARFGLPAGAFAALAARQRQALVDLYVATNGTRWTNNAGWNANTSDPCGDAFRPPWEGVSCNTQQGGGSSQSV
jgi:hypothetical protein